MDGLDVNVLALLYALRIILGNSRQHSHFELNAEFLDVFVSELGPSQTVFGTSRYYRYWETNRHITGILGYRRRSGCYDGLGKPLYKHPEIIWLLCPLILYWISRAWLIARRGLMNQDPVVFMLRDKVSYLSGVLAAMVIALAVG